MSDTLTLNERQPLAVRAAVVGVVTASLHALVVTGVIDVEQEQVVAGVVDSLGALALVLWSLRAVTPNAKVITRVTTDGGVVAGDAAVLDTGQPLQVLGDPGSPKVVPVAVKPELVPIHRGDTAA